MRAASGEGRWLLLVNPSAGSGMSGNRMERVSAQLEKAGIAHETVVTDSPGQLVDFASMASGKGYSGVIALGGDGTVSHAAAGMIHGKTALPVTIVPHGSGNDWARMLGIASCRDTIEAIRGGRRVMLDAAECLVRDKGGSNVHSSIFINSAGIGLDAHVLQKAIRIRRRYRIGRLGYISSLLSTVVEMPGWEGRLEVDGETVFEGPYLSMTCGVGPYAGGGMMLSPSSSPMDDMLDTTVIRPVTRLNLLRSMPMVYRGNLLEHPAVSSWRGGEVSLQAGGELKVELDGEPLTELPDGSSLYLRSIPSAFLTLMGAGQGVQADPRESQ